MQPFTLRSTRCAFARPWPCSTSRCDGAHVHCSRCSVLMRVPTCRHSQGCLLAESYHGEGAGSAGGYSWRSWAGRAAHGSAQISPRPHDDTHTHTDAGLISPEGLQQQAGSAHNGDDAVSLKDEEATARERRVQVAQDELNLGLSEDGDPCRTRSMQAWTKAPCAPAI